MSLPPVEIPLGAMRFNSDSQKLEYFNGEIWFQIHTFNSDLKGGARGLFGGGNAPGIDNTIQYITISTQGDATDFGDLVTARAWGGGTSNSSRGIFFGNTAPTFTNAAEYITIATTGNAADWGDAIYAPQEMGGTSDSHGGLS